MNILRIGILGVSSIAIRKFIPAILKSNNFKIEFVASRSAEKSMKLGKMLKCKYGTYKDLFENSDKIDVVYISTPPNKRVNFFKKCIKKGIHIFSEKPAFTNLSDGKEIISLCNIHKVFFFECWMFKFHPQHLKIKELLNKKIIGECNYFESKFFYPFPDKNNIRLNKKLKGGVLYDSIGYTINAFDLLFNLNKFKSNSLFLFDDKCKVDKLINIQLISNKIISNLSVGFGFIYESYYKIYGSKGIIELRKCYSIDDSTTNEIFIHRNNNIKKIKVRPANHFLIMIDKFAKIIKKNKYINYNNNLNLRYIKIFEELFNK